MVRIADLRVDRAYQRRININSARVVHKICMQFDWSRFLPVIVVPEGDVFHIIDGQHRTTAARTIGIETVPCYVLDCTVEEAAAAFAAINATVTPVSPQDVWFAELHAKNSKAVAVQKVLTRCGVRMVRDREGGRIGDTRSVNEIRRAYDRYGPQVLEVILTAITRMGDRGFGHLNGAVINGLGRALVRKPALLTNPALLYPITDRVDLHEMVAEAKVEHIRTGNIVQSIITREFNALIRASGVLDLED